MKKSNITRNSKRPNLFTEPNLHIPLNRSVPSLAEFLESSSVNVHLRDLAQEIRDGPPESNFKLRDTTKASNKKLAHLLDTSSDITKKKTHTTVDAVDAGSRETPISSPQIPPEELKKRAQLRRLGAVDNFKGADFLKSREFSRFAVAKVLGGKNVHKSYAYEPETKISHSSHIATEPHHTFESEPTIVKNPAKKVARLLTQEDRKPEISRVSHSKKAGLRRSKGLNNESSLERTELSLSRVKRPKQYAPYESQSVLHSAASPLFNTSMNPRMFKEKGGVHERIPTSPEYPDVSSSFILGGQHGALMSKIEEKEREKRKKTNSTSTANANANAAAYHGTAGSSKGVPLHRKGVSGISGISGLPTKPQSETDREVMLRASVEQPGGYHHQSPDLKSGQMSVSGYDTMMSEPVRCYMNSKKGSAQLVDVKEKLKGKEGEFKIVKSDSLVDPESFGKLKGAFDLFLEETLKKMSKTQDQYGLERIIRAWNTFTEDINSVDKHPKKRAVSKEKMRENQVKNRVLTEPERKLSRKREAVNSRVSTSPNHSHISYVSRGKRIASKEHNSPPKQHQMSVEQALFQEGLQELVTQQQSTIHHLRKQEEKLMGLLCDIRTRGFDVEKVYMEGLGKSGDDFLHYCEQPNVFGADDERISLMNPESLDESRGSVPNLINISIPDYQELGTLNTGYSDAKSTTDSTPFPSGDTVSHNRLNPLLKNKLRLDFRGINPEEKEKHVPANLPHGVAGKLNLNLNALRNDQQGGTQEPQGFHEEFMSKIGEFSLSWRQAAMNQRNF